MVTYSFDTDVGGGPCAAVVSHAGTGRDRAWRDSPARISLVGAPARSGDGVPRADGWPGAGVRPDRPRRRAHARAHAVPRPSLEWQDLSLRADALGLRQSAGAAAARRFAELAREMAARAGMAIEPDICIINHYQRDGRMGLHQDKDESEAVAPGRRAGRVGLTRRHRPVPARRDFAAATK